VLQLAWVIGGGCGILLPLIPRLGFGFLAAVLVIVVVLVLRHKPSTPTRPQANPFRPADPGGSGGPGSRGSNGPPEADETRRVPMPHDPTATTRTILTSPDDPTRPQRRSTDDGSGPRAGNPARYNEPTVELRFDPFDDAKSSDQGGRTDKTPPPNAGRWWSGQPDEDETVQDEAPWAAEPTLERKPGPFRRRRSGPDTGTGRRPPR
jgi:cell division protein FtsN